GPWSGIWLNTLNNTSGISTTSLELGDEVTVTGLVTEDFNVTKLDNISSITINDSDFTPPAAEVLQTGDIGTKSGGTLDAEQWESVLVSFENVTVSDINA